MAKCSFCGNILEKGTGKIYVNKKGKIYYFDSGKCEKNMLKLGRKPQKTKWVTKKRKEEKKA